MAGFEICQTHCFPLTSLTAGIWEGRDVAVKQIFHNNIKQAKRAGNEVALCMKLQHPNVVRSFYFEVISLSLGMEDSATISNSSSDSSQRRLNQTVSADGLFQSPIHHFC